jgi:pimeloyl-ACP methyl ester carboxylesterase
MTNFVLVPGAWLGGWAWKRVTPLLEKEGNQVFPVTLTGTAERSHLLTPEVGIETAIMDVMKFEELDKAVLVGHSFAGKVAAAVADRTPEKVSRLVYLDAFRPEKVRKPQGAFDPSEFGPLPPGAIARPLAESTVDYIGKDVKGADREWLLSMATPWPVKHASEPVTLSPAFDSIESAYIFCSGGGDPVDEVIAGKWGKIDGPYKVMDTGHWPMITKPEELAENLISLAGN